MKELSIEEKPFNCNYKAYTELINRLEDVKSAIKNLNYGIAMDVMSKPYPEFQVTTHSELKESEDERIRKEIINYFEHYPNIIVKRDRRNDWIAWLEKQGKNNMGISEATKKKLEDNLNNALEKETPESWNEFLDEQKPADKIVPKFHEGDWIITNKNHIWYVDETPDTTSYLYRLVNQYGKVEVAEFEIVDERARLWTIQDAKPGNVLAYKNDIVIFKENNYNPKDKSGCMFVYCSCNNFHEIGGIAPTDYKPATKEQRDLLFQKMKKAGYEWDAKKKELKKIVTPIFHIGDRVRYKGHACDGVITEITDTDYICGNAKLPISTQDKLELVGQKPAWSEDDETTKNNISHIISQYDKISKRENQPCYYIGDCLLWMQNIKDRVQPKQEWSEEDEKLFNDLSDTYFYNDEDYPEETYKLMLKRVLDWMNKRAKSIRPQTT